MFVHTLQKSHLEKKKILLRKKQNLTEKKVRKSQISEKKVLRGKKTGFANLKKHKNRIYQRKKSDNKNRKKEGFLPTLLLYLYKNIKTFDQSTRNKESLSLHHKCLSLVDKIS